MSLDPNSTIIMHHDTFGSPVKSQRVVKFWMILAAISVLGIVLNLGVLLRRKFTSHRTSYSTRSSLFLLATMAAADTLCLFSLLFLLCLRFFPWLNHPYVLTFVCKLDVFVMHTTSSFSIWCWLVLSAVRYVAVYRPYTHLKLNKEPRLAVLTVAIFCCVSEVWVLWDIEYDDTFKSCVGPETEISRNLQISEMFSSYFLPVIIITFLDLKVIMCRTLSFSHGPKKSVAVRQKISVYSEGCPSPESSVKKSSMANVAIARSRSNGELTTSSSSRSKRRQQMRVLRRCLCITVFDLSMNLPSYLLRLYLTLVEKPDIQWSTIEVMEEISQVMYFAQFALNALYLICIIYDAPKRKSTVLSSQLTAVGLTPRASRKSTRSGFDARLV
uniref:G_PROTEIN_RECEP_F1_2 domain-containing protein n=1 Tax=Caenorhabditis japonica TaxID=281687 RepID=A0A8R1DG26_CAEJA